MPDVLVAISPLKFQQVLVNLLLNAKRAMQCDGGKLSINGRVSGGLVNIEVTDTGLGIPEAIRERLFDPFVTHRDRCLDQGEPKRTGLGLCICRDLVRAAGGSIGVESVVDTGATFHIEFPQADDLFEKI